MGHKSDRLGPQPDDFDDDFIDLRDSDFGTRPSPLAGSGVMKAYELNPMNFREPVSAARLIRHEYEGRCNLLRKLASLCAEGLESSLRCFPLVDAACTPPGWPACLQEMAYLLTVLRRFEQVIPCAAHEAEAEEDTP